ncbi:COG4223 family protein [Roseitranquillus sediminis]|uniref:COG4223 family protein n=1 Tax=Roseitranquillus sediminis TaxID=2809051 RepID=UPI001D0C7341|nr:hypothetical protein [Roseitranquillus sediminis]MBM9596171.1 hypothetical protein [Roseitranquillus sediminis]
MATSRRQDRTKRQPGKTDEGATHPGTVTDGTAPDGTPKAGSIGEPGSADVRDEATSPDAATEAAGPAAPPSGALKPADAAAEPAAGEPDAADRPERDWPADEASVADAMADAPGTPEDETLAAEEARAAEEGSSAPPAGTLAGPPLPGAAHGGTEERSGHEGVATSAAAGAPRHRAEEPARRSGGGGLLMGFLGVLVGALVVWFVLQEMPRDADPEIATAIEGQSTRLQEQEQRLAGLEGDLTSLNEALSSGDTTEALEALRTDAEGRFGGLTETLETMAGRLDAIETQLAETDERLAALEARPVVDPDAAAELLQSEIEDLRQQVAEATAAAQGQVDQATQGAQSEVEAMRQELQQAAEAARAELAAAEQRAAALEEEALATARIAEARAALRQVQAALDAGTPYVEPLETLRAATDLAMPGELIDPADTGVPTLAELRQTYPDAARSALAATSVATTQGDPGERFLSFLRTQTQARSLAPREGDDPDAILSRAEAALEAGELQTALDELAALPEDGLAAMQEWLSTARLRAQAIGAAQSVEQTLN